MLKKDLLAEIDAKVKKKRDSNKTIIKHVGIREFLISWLSAAIADMDRLKAKGSSGSRIQYCLSTVAETLYTNIRAFDHNASVNLKTAVDDEAEGEDDRARSLRIDGVTVALSSGEIVSVDTADLLMRALDD